MSNPAEAAERVLTLRRRLPAGKPDTEDLVELADRFIALKRGLGHSYEVQGQRIMTLVRFLHDQGVWKSSELCPEVFLAWADSRQGVSRRTWHGELAAASVFMDHLIDLGKLGANYCLLLKGRFRWNYQPYIYSLEELRKIFWPPDAYPARARRAIIYHLIYAAALRVSEALKLRIRDFDPKARTIFISRTKFGKSRLLPIHESIASRLEEHIREHRKGALAGEPIFVTRTGRAYTPRQSISKYPQDLRLLGLHRPTYEKDGVRWGSTRLHALRHTFACHRILKWYRDGVDVQSKLPLLSTYLGHAEVAYTQVYITITAAILRQAKTRFSDRFEKEFPLQP
jgi:integrase